VKLGRLAFKPAVCGGVGCKMQFMFRANFEIHNR
jgi:hypothetical protein